MKSELLFVLLFVVANQIFAQEKINSYESTYTDGTYSVSATEPKNNGDFTFYIECYSRSSRVNKITLNIERKKLTKFKEALVKAKEKYIEWKQVAIDNNVEELDKEIEVGILKVESAFLYGSKWKFDFSVKLKMRFKIVKGQYLLIISNTRELVASSNQFMTTDGFYIVLSTVEEIDAFINTLNTQDVVNHYNNKDKKEDLFKN